MFHADSLKIKEHFNYCFYPLIVIFSLICSMCIYIERRWKKILQKWAAAVQIKGQIGAVWCLLLAFYVMHCLEMAHTSFARHCIAAATPPAVLLRFLNTIKYIDRTFYFLVEGCLIYFGLNNRNICSWLFCTIYIGASINYVDKSTKLHKIV